MELQEVRERDQKTAHWKKEIITWIRTIAVILILVGLVRGFLFTNYIVHGQSMMPTIHDGERIIVNKIGYEIGVPERFDLIIFHATEESDYIKRIIGVPGDHVMYKGDTLFVNGEPYEEDFLKHNRENYEHGLFTEDFSLESITGYEQVPEGYVFVLGDNRRNSLDSRHIGFVKVEDIVGKANLAYWPPKNFRFYSTTKH
ncbi:MULTISPECIES: signal peptidase I [Bacillaceae]|uniref:Signal peptidase I n=1 Tax=Evansella alkalicola TaxID=745819 RepID=A0ABS6JQM9_9BACI|nr:MULTISPECIES: signal peptidase I [Bacillaceae]MBU9720849.1 signal peptidase I [Bacillus alkalicola]